MAEYRLFVSAGKRLDDFCHALHLGRVLETEHGCQMPAEHGPDHLLRALVCRCVNVAGKFQGVGAGKRCLNQNLASETRINETLSGTAVTILGTLPLAREVALVHFMLNVLNVADLEDRTQN